jgi:hypothetical protein
MLNQEPITKSQFIQSIQRTQINSSIIKDTIAKSDLPAIQKELKDFIGVASRNVSLIAIKES